MEANFYMLHVAATQLSAALILSLSLMALPQPRQEPGLDLAEQDAAGKIEGKESSDKLQTRWAALVDREMPWQEHPRPQMRRENWLCLNGEWDFAVAESDADRPAKWDGKILVPFPLESSLSGVAGSLKTDQRLWYRKTISIPKAAEGSRFLLHFGAVDWEAEVWLDEQRLGIHRGGYDPFTFELPTGLQAGDGHQLVVAVRDPTDSSTQPRGKQVMKPGGIWYTPVSGIWQTVWLEVVPRTYLKDLRLNGSYLKGQLQLDVQLDGPTDGCRLKYIITPMAEISWQGGKPQLTYSSQEAPSKSPSESQQASESTQQQVIDPSMLTDGPPQEGSLGIRDGGFRDLIQIEGAMPWSPEMPILYQIRLELSQDGWPIDSVNSYFGLRDLAMKKDAEGVNRLYLNGEPYFQLGLLDQGYWPDGIYTAPTDAALRYDLIVAKDLGFNMMRKHVKVEPARWYAWCDWLGMLAWQDMPSGGKYIGPNDPDAERSAASAKQFESELAGIMDALINHPSLVAWVPFNEGWGQFDTARIAKWVKRRDPNRIVNAVSGWADRPVGEMLDIHSYPGPSIPPLNAKRAAVLGEFGGLGLPVAGHTWQKEANWGYRNFDSADALTDAYVQLIQRLHPMISQGLCAAIYTQISDVEIEVNGLLTYDREVLKVDAKRVREAHRRLKFPPSVLEAVLENSQESAQ